MTVHQVSLPILGQVRQEVRAHLTANKGLSVSSGEFNIDSANVKGMFSAGGDLLYNSSTGEFSLERPEIDSAGVRALVSVTDAGGDGSLSYNNGTGVFTYTGPSASEVRAHLTANKGLAVSNGEFNIDSANVRAMVSVTDAGGDGSLSYNASTGVLTYTGPSASEAQSHLTANKGLSVSSGEFNIDSDNVKGMFAGNKGLSYSDGTFNIDSANVRAMLSGGTGITYNSGTGAITTTDGDIVHDNLSGFVANEHIDHTSVSVTAGRGLTGGGTIAATRTVAIDSAELLAYF